MIAVGWGVSCGFVLVLQSVCGFVWVVDLVVDLAVSVLWFLW